MKELHHHTKLYLEWIAHKFVKKLSNTFKVITQKFGVNYFWNIYS